RDPRSWHCRGPRRFRHRLFLDRLPQAFHLRPPEARPLAHQRHQPRPPRPASRPGDHRHCRCARPPRHGGRRRARRGGNAASRRRLRRVPGLFLCRAEGGRRHHSSPRRDLHAGGAWPDAPGILGAASLWRCHRLLAIRRGHACPSPESHAFPQGVRSPPHCARRAGLRPAPLALHPLMRWRMQRARDHVATRPWFTKFGEENRDYIRAVRDEIAAAGPVTVDALTDPGERTGPWWGWNRGKSAVEYLFRTGEVTTVGRRAFERVYDLTERAIPSDILALPSPSEPDAIRELARLSGEALG